MVQCGSRSARWFATLVHGIGFNCQKEIIQLNTWSAFRLENLRFGSGQAPTSFIGPEEAAALPNAWILMPRHPNSGDLTMHIGMNRAHARHLLLLVKDWQLPFELVQ